MYLPTIYTIYFTHFSHINALEWQPNTSKNNQRQLQQNETKYNAAHPIFRWSNSDIFPWFHIPVSCPVFHRLQIGKKIFFFQFSSHCLFISRSEFGHVQSFYRPLWILSGFFVTSCAARHNPAPWEFWDWYLDAEILRAERRNNWCLDAEILKEEIIQGIQT